MNRRLIALSAVLVLVVFVAAQCQQADAFRATTAAPAGTAAPWVVEGASLLQERCTVCHGLARVQSAQKSEADWRATVDRMVAQGAHLSSAEQETLIKYLAATYK